MQLPKEIAFREVQVCQTTCGPPPLGRLLPSGGQRLRAPGKGKPQMAQTRRLRSWSNETLRILQTKPTARQVRPGLGWPSKHDTSTSPLRLGVPGPPSSQVALPPSGLGTLPCLGRKSAWQLAPTTTSTQPAFRDGTSLMNPKKGKHTNTHQTPQKSPSLLRPTLQASVRLQQWCQRCRCCHQQSQWLGGGVAVGSLQDH